MVINETRGWILGLSDLEEEIVKNRGRTEEISNKIGGIN